MSRKKPNEKKIKGSPATQKPVRLTAGKEALVWFTVITILCLLEWRGQAGEEGIKNLPNNWWIYSLSNAAFFYFISLAVFAISFWGINQVLPQQQAHHTEGLKLGVNILNNLVKLFCSVLGVVVASVLFPYFFIHVSHKWVLQTHLTFGMAIILGNPLYAALFFAILYFVVQGMIWLVRKRDAGRLA